MGRRSGSYYAVRCFFVFSLFLAALVGAIVRGGDQYDYSQGGVKGSRAPRNCPNRPDHCTPSVQLPWTCRPGSDCIRKDLNIQPDSKFVKSDASVNLSASTYYFHAGGNKCYHALNLTWTMNPKGIVGFYLRAMRYCPSRGIFNRSRNFTFWIDEQRLTPERERDNGMVTFYSDCLRLVAASKYHFDLFSIHAVPNSNETASKFIGSGSLATDCDTYPEADPVFRIWDAFTNIAFDESDSSVKVFFSPAAQSLGFHSYDVSIYKPWPSVILAGVYNLAFTCTNFDAVVIRNICPGTYSLVIIAKGGFCPCRNSCSNCTRKTEFDVPGLKDDCRNDNIRLFVPSLVTSESPATPRMLIEESTSQTARVTNNNTLVNGILITAFGVVIAIAIITVAVHSRQCKKPSSPVESAITVATDSEEHAVVEKGLEKQTVLVIYARDNVYHCRAVRCWASYLERRCYCRVKLDEWCSDEIGELSTLDWLLIQMENVDSIVIVNSEAGWRQYEGDSRNVSYRKIINDTPFEDVFLPAVKYLRNKYYTQPSTKKNGGHKLFKVAFPYTDPKFFITDIHPGRTYLLMDHIEEFFLNVHRLSKHSGDGNTKTAVGINGSDYVRCPEGRQLQAAIDQAVEYFRSSAPDWFRSFYSQEQTTPVAIQQTMPPPTCCDVPSLSASPEDWERLHSVLDSGVGSSAEYIYLGTNFVPPNVGDGGDDDDDDDDDEDNDSIVRVNLSAAIVKMNKAYDEEFQKA